MIVMASIIEGEGEVDSVPLLLRRIARNLDPHLEIQAPPPIRRSRGKLIQKGILERDVQAAAVWTKRSGGVLVLIDSDDDCPKERAPGWAQRASGARTDLPVGLILAQREFEGWFLEAAPSLRGKAGLPANFQRPVDADGRSRAEQIRDAKGWIERSMGRKYRPVFDQPTLTQSFSLTLARRARSFDKCYREVVKAFRSFEAGSTFPDEDQAVEACAARCDVRRVPADFDPWPTVEHYLLTHQWVGNSDELWWTLTRLRQGLTRWSLAEEPRYGGFWRVARALFVELAHGVPPANQADATAERDWAAAYLSDLELYLHGIQALHLQPIYENPTG